VERANAGVSDGWYRRIRASRATSDSVASAIASAGALRWARELHHPGNQTMRPAGQQPDHEGAIVDPAQPAHDPRAKIEHHQHVTQEACEERQLVGARDRHLLGRDDDIDGGFNVRARQLCVVWLESEGSLRRDGARLIARIPGPASSPSGIDARLRLY
jgi:hypothetical protein